MNPTDPNQMQGGAPVAPPSSAPSQMMIVQILKMIQPFIQKMVAMEVQKAMGTATPDQTDPNMPDPNNPGVDMNGQPLDQTGGM